MLGLQLPTDPRWAHAAEDRLEEILTDHAYCEQKAASTAISLMVTYPCTLDPSEKEATILASKVKRSFQRSSTGSLPPYVRANPKNKV